MSAPTTTNPPEQHILVGDAHNRLHTLPAASVDMVLTSPPYFRLRDYQIDGQLGLETEVEEWVTALRGIARELHRVLVPTGSFWLNVGDSYATHLRQGAPRKSLLLGPERLALALVADGWILRNKIVWAKRNPMPSSVRDRLNCTWEYVYVFTKQPRSYFDLDAIRVPHTSTPATPKSTLQPVPHKEHWRGPNGKTAAGLIALKTKGIVGHPLGKNPGDVWQISSSNYRGGHHATFPLELARRAIQAGCPSDGTVLDPFFGAGTTAVAAEQLGRSWIGIELNPHFAALAADRLRQARASPPAKAA